MKNAPTPETDAHEYHFENHDPSAGESLFRCHDGRNVAWDDDYAGPAVPATLARKLERERDALRLAVADFIADTRAAPNLIGICATIDLLESACAPPEETTNDLL